MQRPILIVVQKQHQLIFLPLAAGLVQFQLVAELTLKDCGEGGGAEGEGYTWQSKSVFTDAQKSLVSTERDECGTPAGGQVRWVAHLG